MEELVWKLHHHFLIFWVQPRKYKTKFCGSLILMLCRRHTENDLGRNTAVVFFWLTWVLLGAKESIIIFLTSHIGVFIQKLCCTFKSNLQKHLFRECWLWDGKSKSSLPLLSTIPSTLASLSDFQRRFGMVWCFGR